MGDLGEVSSALEKLEVFSGQKDSKAPVGDQNPGVVERSPRKTGPEMGAGCVRTAVKLDLDLSIPSCQPGFPEAAWGRVFPISPKVALARVIHWVLLLGQQDGSPGQPATPAETSGPHWPVHPCG